MIAQVDDDLALRIAGTFASAIDRLGARPLDAIPRGAPPPLLRGRRDPIEHTILYGTGDAGKGSLTSSWIVEGVGSGERFLILDYEHHPGEWARRIHGLGGADAVAAVVHVSPMAASWGGVRGPLWEQADEIRELATETGATYLVIDSIGTACAGLDPLKAEAAVLYATGLQLIGLPALSIAHVTKADDLRYPFGTVFWHNLARLTWSLARDGERAVLVNRKSNNYRRAGRFVVETLWVDDTLREVRERPYSAVLSDRIDDVLEPAGLTASQIVSRLAEGLDNGETAPKADSVRAALRRGIPDRYTVDGTGTDALYRRVDQ